MSPKPVIVPQESILPITSSGRWDRQWLFFFRGIASRLEVLRDTVIGWSALTHAGAIPKVSAAGELAESAVTDDGATVTATERDIAASGARAAFKASTTGGTQPARWGKLVDDDRSLWTLNLSFDGAEWNLDDVSQAGYLVRITAAGEFSGWTCPAHANPVTAFLVEAFHIDGTGHADVLAAYKVAGTQVVGAQGAAVTAPTGGGTVVAAPAGGGVIDVQARAAIGLIIAAIAATGNTVDPAARTAINDIRARLTAHGLTL